MGHKHRSAAEFFTDMFKRDDTLTSVSKIVLILEIAFTTAAFAFFFIQYHFRTWPTYPAADELEAFLLMLAHMGTTLALIKMVKTFQKGYSPYFLDGWWLPICALFDLRTILISRHGPWGTAETGDYLLAMGITGIIIGGGAFVLFMISKWRPPHATEDSTTSGGIPAPPARDDLEQNNSQINASMASGVVSVRFPSSGSSGKFVHQPARKGD